MSTSLLLGCFWVLAAVITAMLPMRRQYIPGVSLLVLAPLLLGCIGVQHGVWVALLGFAAFVSMFRNPLRYFWRRFRGENPESPK